MKSNRATLETEIALLEKLIEAHKKTVLDRFGQDAKKSIEELVKAFWRDRQRSFADAPREFGHCAFSNHLDCAYYMCEMEAQLATYGYARVSTDGQSLDGQLGHLKAAGCVHFGLIGCRMAPR